MCNCAGTGVIVNTILPNGQPAQTRVPLEVAIQMIRNQQMEQQRTPALNRSLNSRTPQVVMHFRIKCKCMCLPMDLSSLVEQS